jgi:transcriptional regulator with XRE-family HTH domain
MDMIEQAKELRRLRGLVVTGQARSIRQRARISMDAIARQVGVREATLSRWELGLHEPRDPKAALAWLALLDQLAEIPSDDAHQEEALVTAGA